MPDAVRDAVRLARLALALTILMVGLEPSRLAAQDVAGPSADAQILALKAEVEQLKATLAEITARLDHLASSSAPPTSEPISGSPATRPAAPMASVPPRFDFVGDTLVRLATLHTGYSGCTTCPRRTIERLRLRIGAEGRLARDFRAAVGLSTGELNDPNSVYQTLGGNLSRKVVTFDRGYVLFRPQKASWLELQAGKFPYPWVRSSMTFDVDFYPEGASEKVVVPLPSAAGFRNLSLQAFQVVLNEQPASSDAALSGGQVIVGGLRVGPAVSRVILTGIDLKHPEYLLRAQLDGSDVGVRNTNDITSPGPSSVYASGFRYANVMAETTMTTPWPSLPVTATLELHKNLRAASSRDSAESFRIDIGRQQNVGDWGFGYHLFRVEQEAIVSALGESDWRAPSNVIQQRIAATLMIQDHVQLLTTLYRGRTLDRTLPNAIVAPALPAGRNDPWTNRWYFDVRYIF